MASGELSLTSNSSQEFDCFPEDRNARNAATDSPKDFESAKQQYDQAIIELNSLRLQHSDSKRRMDHIMEQLEFYREQYMAAMNQVEQSAQEGTNLRTKYSDISNENSRLQQRNHHLEKKLARFVESMKQEKENGNSQTVCAFVEQYNELKKKYDNSRVELEKLTKETEKCKNVCSDLSRDRNSLALEKDDLKQQLSNSFAQIESSLREKNMYREARDKLIQQHDDDIREMTQLMQTRAEEVRRLTVQRNAAQHELRTILAERKGVLEENQKLSDDLMSAKEELSKHYKDDKKIAYENDSLKREIESVLRYKDGLMKECASLREQLEEATKKAENRDLLKSRDSGWSKDLSSEQHILDIESANQEIEKLRKNLERAMTEIEKAALETDVAKSRRDWAISEREKIVLERDSVKILCDELRKERDTAISNLLATIRDSEKIKKQKDEACKEVEQVREQMRELINPQYTSASPWSTNSPYDIELIQKNADIEVVELDMSMLNANASDPSLGIILEGGREDSPNRNDSSIVVVNVAADSIAYGKLRPNDYIVKVNKLDCSSVSKRTVYETIRTSGSRCSIVVKRPKVNKSHMYVVQLSMAGGDRNHGLTLETGVFISKIAPGSLAAKNGDLLAGDRVLSINSKTMEGVKTAKSAMAYLDDNRADSLTVIALKHIAQPAVDSSTNVKQCKVTNNCTQTNERFTNAEFDANRNISSSNSKSTSKISEMINKFKGKMHMPGHNNSNSSSNQKGSTVSETDSLCQENDAIAVLDLVLNNENSNGKSKDNLFKRSKRSKKDSSNKDANKNLGTWPRANVLCSTHHDNHTGTIVQSRKKERPPLSFFTGPITLGKEDKQTNQASATNSSTSSSKKENYFTINSSGNSATVTNKSSTAASNLNRNSNPIPFHVLCPPPPSVHNRHTVYAIEQEPVLLENSKAVPQQSSMSMGFNTLTRQKKLTLDMGLKHQHPGNTNRLSLNLSPTITSDQGHSSTNHLLYNTLITMRKSPIDSSKITTPTQQNSLDYIPNVKNSTDSFLNPKSTMSSMDFKRNSMQSPQPLKDLISLKSQNSIDSFLVARGSPQSMEFSMKSPPRESTELYGIPPSRMSRNVSKYPSDSDSLGMENSIPLSPGTHSYTGVGMPQQISSYNAQSRVQSIPTPTTRAQRAYPSYGGGGPAAFLNHHYPSIRKSSPLTINSLNSTDKLEFEYITPHHSHSHGVSMDVDSYGRNKPLPVRDRDILYGSGSYAGGGGHSYEGGTFPRKKENPRFRIPSNPSVASKGSGVKNSTGSIEHGSERGSPMPPAFQVEVLSHGVNKRNSMPDYCYGQKPSPGDLRRVTIDKSVELGITIDSNNNGGGIFISKVAENSIASQVSDTTEICILLMLRRELITYNFIFTGRITNRRSIA